MTRSAARRRTRARTRVLQATGMGLGVLLVITAIVSLLRGPGTGRATIEVTGQPRLRVNRQLVDLGAVRLGQTVEASFTLTNVGDQPLRLTQAPYIEVVEGC